VKVSYKVSGFFSDCHYKQKVELFLSLISYALRHEDVWGSGGIAPRFFTLVLVRVCGHLHATAALPPGNSPRYKLDRRQGGQHSRSGGCGEERDLLLLPGIVLRVSSP
jgi:hypothetical protein